MPGELQRDGVIVRPQNEANRIHNKGRFGRPLSGGALRLDWVEAAYLCEVGRLSVESGGKSVPWADLLVAANRADPDFEVRYLAYRDYRERGSFLSASPAPEAKRGAHFRLWDRATEGAAPPTSWLRVASERAPLVLSELHTYAAAAREDGKVARLAVVDEESDLTHYELDVEPPSGRRAPEETPPAKGRLLGDRILVPDAGEATRLHAHEFFGKPIGRALQLSLVEAAYLLEKGRLDLVDPETGKTVSATAFVRRARDLEPQVDLRLRAFGDLKERGLIVKTGFKFGTHFRAYAEHPESGHAPFLVQAVAPDFQSSWEPIARAVRLSHSVRKRFFLAAAGRDGVAYLSFGRLRV